MKAGQHTENESTCRAADVRETVAFLAEAVRPEKVFLLNSPLPDAAGEKGYIDLLVVLPHRSHILFREHQELVEFANLRDRHVTCSLHRSDAVQEALKQGHIFYSLSCTPANLVYDDGSNPLPATPPELHPRMREAALQVFGENYGRALAFYGCASHCLHCGQGKLVPFMLHQAAELTYRAILLSLMKQEARTHSIKALIRHSRRCAPQLNSVFPRDTPEEKQLVHQLEEAYLKARYEQDYVLDAATTALLCERVRQLQAMAKRVFEEKVRLFR